MRVNSMDKLPEKNQSNLTYFILAICLAALVFFFISVIISSVKFLGLLAYQNWIVVSIGLVVILVLKKFFFGKKKENTIIVERGIE